MLKHVFLDLDDTILNFTAGEAKALTQALRESGIEPTEAILDRYHLINVAHWELLEEGRITREEVLVRRFEQLFRELGIPHSGVAVNDRYEHLLSRQHDFIPGAEQLLKDLAPRYDLYLASNGAAAVQHPRAGTPPASGPISRAFLSPKKSVPTSPPKRFSVPASPPSPVSGLRTPSWWVTA